MNKITVDYSNFEPVNGFLMKPTLQLLSNKFLITLGAFTILMLFFDRNDVFTQLDRKKQLKALQNKKEFYEQEIEKTRKELADIQNNTAALEKYVREKYFMKKDNEDIFIVEENNVPKAE